jgi:hypothetical protein
MNKENSSEDPWLVGTFDGARKAQIRESMSRTAGERIKWACDMSECIRDFNISKKRIPPALNAKRNS